MPKAPGPARGKGTVTGQARASLHGQLGTRWVRRLDRLLMGLVMSTLAFGAEQAVRRIQRRSAGRGELHPHVALSVAPGDVSDESGGEHR